MAMNMPETPALNEALRLASHGFKVIRLHWPTKQGCSCGRPNCKKSIGKHPIANNWVAAGTDDPNTIRKLWQETPYANVGVPMGQINGIFALDIDGQEGMQTLQRWIAEHGTLPATWQVQTGGGGIQLWYKVPDGLSIPNSVKKIGVNVDIRGDGGQSVAPGSLHKSGRRYQWAPGRSPEDIPLADPPGWLIDKIKEVIHSREKADLAGIKLDGIDIELNPGRPPNFKKLEQLILSSQKFREIVEGKRTFPSPSERDLAMANICAINGWTDQEIADLLLGQRKISGDDLKHPLYYQLTIGKARRWAEEQKTQGMRGQEQPTEIEVEPIPLPEKPKIEPFPIDVFPDPVRRLIEEVSESVGSPPDFSATHALVFLGTAIGSTRTLEIKPGYRQQANLYAGVIAEPSTGKSPAQNYPFKPLQRIQNEYVREYQNLMDHYETQMLQYEVELSNWKKRKKDGDDTPPPEEPQRPVIQDVYTTQTTLEALFRILKDNPRGIVIKLDELNGLIESLNQYKNGGDDREQYLSMWTGGDLKIERVRNREKGEVLYLPQTFLAISGNIPTEKLSRLASGEEDGFVDRFLLSFPDNQKMKEEEDFQGVPDALQEEYNELVMRLYQLKPERAGEQWTPKVLTLSEAAKEWWSEWKSINAREANDPDFPRRLISVWGKMENQLARLSLIIHMLRVVTGEAEDGQVDEISLNRAIQIVKYFKSHARKVYQYIGTTPEDKRIKEVIEWIKRQGGTVKRRDIQKNNVAGYKKASDVDRLFEELEDLGYGRKVVINGRGRPSVQFTLFENK